MGLVPATSESGRLSRLRERLKDGQRDRPAHRSLLIGFTVAWCILAGTILGDFAKSALPPAVLPRPLGVATVGAVLIGPLAIWKTWGAPVAALISVLLITWDATTVLFSAMIGVVLVMMSILRLRMTLDLPILVGAAVFAVAGLIQAVSVVRVTDDEPSSDLSAYTHGLYLILLDGYPRADTLASLGIEIDGFLHELTSRGFDHYPNARSEHTYTFRTIAAMFSNEPPPDSDWGTAAERREVRNRLRLPPGFVMVTQFQDYFTIPGAVDLAGRGLNAFEVSLLRKTPLRATRFVQKLIIEGLRSGVEHAFSVLETTEERHVFAHVLAPHGPFLYSSSGSDVLLPQCWPHCNPFDHEIHRLGMSMEDWVDGLAGSLEVLNRRVVEVIDSIISRDPDSIIVVMSDHGARYSNAEKAEWYRSMLLARTPAVPDAFGSEPTPRQVVRKALELARTSP